jgi:putative Holliday junction resolvase
LDVGEKRIGVAVSDEMQMLARPVKAIPHTSMEGDIQALAGLTAEYKTNILVIGYPRSLSGEEGPQALRVRRYAERVASALPVQVVLWDERYSTVEAAERLMAAGRKPQARGDKGQIDAAAAAVILQDYLDSKRDT